MSFNVNPLNTSHEYIYTPIFDDDEDYSQTKLLEESGIFSEEYDLNIIGSTFTNLEGGNRPDQPPVSLQPRVALLPETDQLLNPSLCRPTHTLEYIGNNFKISIDLTYDQQGYVTLPNCKVSGYTENSVNFSRIKNTSEIKNTSDFLMEEVSVRILFNGETKNIRIPFIALIFSDPQLCKGIFNYSSSSKKDNNYLYIYNGEELEKIYEMLFSQFSPIFLASIPGFSDLAENIAIFFFKYRTPKHGKYLNYRTFIEFVLCTSSIISKKITINYFIDMFRKKYKTGVTKFDLENSFKVIEKENVIRQMMVLNELILKKERLSIALIQDQIALPSPFCSVESNCSVESKTDFEDPTPSDEPANLIKSKTNISPNVLEVPSQNNLPSANEVSSMNSELFNNYIRVFRNNYDLNKELKKAYFLNRGNFSFYIDKLPVALKNELLNPIITFIEKKNYRDARIEIVKNFCTHFGIKFSSNLVLPRCLNPLKNNLVSIIQKYSLSKNYCSYLVPSLIEHKIQQWGRMDHSTSLVDMTFDVSWQVCFFMKAHSSKVVLIPSIIKFKRRDKNSPWNDHIFGLVNDGNQGCLNYLNIQLGLSLKANDNGTIELEKDQFNDIFEKFKEQSRLKKFGFYILKYEERLSIKDEEIEDDFSDEDPLVDIEDMETNADNMEIDEPKEQKTKKKNLLKKREKSECQTEIPFDEDLFRIKRRKGNDDDYETTISGSSKIKKVRKEENESSIPFSFDDVRKKQINANLESEPISLVAIRSDLPSSLRVKPGIDLNADWSDYLGEYLKSIANIVEKKVNASSLYGLKPMVYPIAGKLQQVSLNEVAFPFIGSLMPYQAQAYNQISSALKNGIVPILSLSMGLGKTPIYMSLVAKMIAEKEEGRIVIATTAATRDKTIQEIYAWLSEAKLTAILSEANREPAAFDNFWRTKLLMAKHSVIESNNILTFWEWWQPLLLSAYRLSDNFSVRYSDNDTFLANIGAAISAYIKNVCEKNSGFLDEFKKIEKLSDINNGYCLDRSLSIKQIIAIVKKVAEISPFERVNLSPNLFLPKEQNDRLLKFDFSKIGKGKKTTSSQKGNEIVKKQRKTKAQSSKAEKDILAEKDAIVVLSYKALADLCIGKDREVLEESPLFQNTRFVIADEASKVHTEGTNGNIAMKALGEKLKEFGTQIIPVTGTPFENNIGELLELINISNLSEGSQKVVSNIQKENLSSLAKKSTEALSDYIVKKNSKSAEKMRKMMLYSFVHSFVLGESVIRKLVIELGFNHKKVQEDWKDRVPFAKIKKIEFPYTGLEIQKKIEKIIQGVFTQKRKNEKVSEIGILSIAPSLARMHIDDKLPLKSEGKRGKSTILDINDPTLKNAIENIKQQIASYKAGNKAALDNNFLAKMMIENPKLHKLLSSQEKVIIAYMYKAEAEILSVILKCYYGRKTILFGEDDKKRSINLEAFKQDEGNTALLLPQEAGGVGLNLGYVDNMIFINDCWNGAEKDQAKARILRVGRGGNRRIFEIFFDNIYNDFVQFTTKRKKELSSFYLSPGTTLKEKLQSWTQIQILDCIKNFLLSSLTPGYFKIKDEIEEVAILKKHAKPGSISIEERLEKAIADMMEEISEEELSELVDRATYKEPEKAVSVEVSEPLKALKPEQTLDPKIWRVLPLPQQINFEECARLASFIVNPENNEIVIKHLSSLGFFLNKYKNNPNELQNVLNLARSQGDKGINALLVLANRQPADNLQTAVYTAGPQGFNLQNHLVKGENPHMGLLYLKEGNPPRVDVLVKSDFISKLSESFNVRK